MKRRRLETTVGQQPAILAQSPAASAECRGLGRSPLLFARADPDTEKGAPCGSGSPTSLQRDGSPRLTRRRLTPAPGIAPCGSCRSKRRRRESRAARCRTSESPRFRRASRAGSFECVTVSTSCSRPGSCRAAATRCRSSARATPRRPNSGATYMPNDLGLVPVLGSRLARQPTTPASVPSTNAP